MFRIITGAIISLGGLFLLVGGVMEREGSAVVGLIALAIGVAILLNKKEDEIEEITNDKNDTHE